MENTKTMEPPISKLDRFLFEHGKISQADLSRQSKINNGLISQITTGGLYPTPEQASATVRALRGMGHTVEVIDLFNIIKG